MAGLPIIKFPAANSLFCSMTFCPPTFKYYGKCFLTRSSKAALTQSPHPTLAICPLVAIVVHAFIDLQIILCRVVVKSSRYLKLRIQLYEMCELVSSFTI